MQKEVYGFADLSHWQAVEPPIRLAVFGDPVAHSASPPMHNAALAHFGIPICYTRLHIRPDELAESLRLIVQNGFLGVNLTIPHKAAALPLVARVDSHAQRIGAINTVAVEDGSLTGFNTDGPGFARAIRAEFGVDLRDLRILVLGAGGGAGRAIAFQCAAEQCERLVLVNRTAEKGRALFNELEPLFQTPRVSGPGDRLESVAWQESLIQERLQQIDLVVNCSPLGMKGTDPSPLPSSILAPSMLVYDTIYTATRTRLMLAADEAGARSANGFSMLLHQGALAFEIWFNRQAPLDIMRAALRAHAEQVAVQ